MEFRVSEEVRLRGTAHEWQLQRCRARKTESGTSVEWQPFRYYPSLSKALQSCLEYDLRISEDWDDLRRRVERIEDIAREAESHLRGIADRVAERAA